LDDIKDAMSKLRKISIHQETQEFVSEKINESNNQAIIEENFLVSTNTNSNDLVNQVFIYEKSNDIKDEDIVSSIKEIDDVLESVDTIPEIAAATNITNDDKMPTEINKLNHDEKSNNTTWPKGTIASITASLVENLHLPASELQGKNRKKNLKEIQTQPEVSTPEFFKVKLKHVPTNFD
jgi:hypothetical protein